MADEGRKAVRLLEKGLALGIRGFRRGLFEAGAILDEIPKSWDRLGNVIEETLHELDKGAEEPCEDDDETDGSS